MADRANAGYGRPAPRSTASEASLRQVRPPCVWTQQEDQIVLNGYEAIGGATPIRELREQIPNHTKHEIQVRYWNLCNTGLTRGQLQRLGRLWIRFVVRLQSPPLVFVE